MEREKNDSGAMTLTDDGSPPAWCLAGFSRTDGSDTWRTLLRRVPFHVGRRFDCDLCLTRHTVSSRHASFFLRNDALHLRDLESRNGTFVNGERVTSDHPVSADDVIFFADQGCRLLEIAATEPVAATETMSLFGSGIDRPTLERDRRLRRMLRSTRLRAAFQPVVGLADNAMVGYELLGRGEVSAQEILPSDLFSVASTFGVERELSSAFRAKGMEQANELPGDPAIFLNTHPAELEDDSNLIASLEHLRAHHPSPRLVLEIHEAAIANLSTLQAMSSHLTYLGIGLAFDDFGVGQTRLLELVDACPHYVKFDRAWITDLHLAPPKRRQMVETLVGLLKQLDVGTVAEGIETVDEARACIDLGFELAQGFYFGHPAPAADFAAGS
ncbi:MAG: EAL domain-containing protein [bacterium]|nr:EAL domain-containing protein [bacterium]